MKKILILLSVFFFIGFQLSAQSDAAKRKSPLKVTEEKIGDVKLKIIYSSPAVNDREIYGHLVLYSKVWRAGANEATTIEFSRPVRINGKKLDAGKYSFFVIPNRTEKWTIIFNTKSNQWGAFSYDKSQDALRTETDVKRIDKVENLTYGIENNYVFLDWENKRILFKVD